MSPGLIIRKRVALIFLTFMAVFLLLGGRVFWLTFVRGTDLQQKSIENRTRMFEVKARRGVIYDRNGKELAISVSTSTIYAIPPEVKRSGQAPGIAAVLARELQLDEQKVLRRITQNVGFVFIKRNLSFEVSEKIEKLKLPGINFVEENQRFYPRRELAVHLLGMAGIDNQGLEGLDKVYDQELRGKPGYIAVEFDAGGREIPRAYRKYIPPVDGNSLITSIDERIQTVVERELDRVVAERQPKQATVIIMDPRNGEILALGNRPAYDPNARYDAYPAAFHRNNAISNAYEPGSTFKIITASGGLAEGVFRTDERFFDPGFARIGKETVRCWKAGGHGSQTFLEVAKNSCNPGFIEIGQRLGIDRFFKYLRGFGFGQPTGIYLTGEAKGITVPQKRAKLIDVATMSIGQANAVTPIQLINAVSAAVNGGILYQPRLIREIRTPAGKVRQIKPIKVRRVIPDSTSKQMREILEAVVQDGTGIGAVVEGYRIGGKTGTAQKAIGGGYVQGRYVASFIGFAPADDPQVVALVIIDEPQGYPYYGGLVAAPVFQAIMKDVLRILEIPHTAPKQEEDAPQPVEVPDVTHQAPEMAELALQQLGLTPVQEGQGPVVTDQTPKGGASVSKGSSVLIYLGPATAPSH